MFYLFIINMSFYWLYKFKLINYLKKINENIIILIGYNEKLMVIYCYISNF